MPTVTDIDQTCLKVVRGLAIDAVQKANSGHPGMPMGAAAMAHALWTRHLKHDPSDPKWPDRDRFVLSAGHGSMLLYALLFLTGYELTLEDIKRFRQWGSATPGHPENFVTPGVEMATGPLGQGISTAVGMAIAERYLAARYNRDDHHIVDHRTYVIASDGDLMEGVANEACSLAGHLGLNKLTVLYDDNRITIDGRTDLAYSENVPAKFEAIGWSVLSCDGMDVEAVDACIRAARESADKPTLIVCKTTIGYGSPNKAGTAGVHGSPLGVDEAALTKRALGIPDDQEFWIDDDAIRFYRSALTRGREAHGAWNDAMARYAEAFPDEADAYRKSLTCEPGTDWTADLPVFDADEATRDSSGKVLNAVAGSFPDLLSGSADLTDNVKTRIKGSPEFSKVEPTGRNLALGVREHAMAAAFNGITLHGGTRACGGSFLIFSDYCRPSIRLAALMECPTVFVFSHDSIGLGEDGPTHQPIEQIASLRAVPNLNVMRPADGNETSACWKVALEAKKTPSMIVLTRQKVKLLTPGMVTRHPAEKGAYVVREASGGAPAMILIGTGSELGLAVAAGEALEAQGVATRVVSMPSWFLFEKQSDSYRGSVLPKGVPTVSVEAASTFGWAKYAQAHVGIDHFGASAPADVLFREFGFTVENVVATAQSLLG
ncbi:MAG: transketolase [Armatimonadetes bacterium]|nr:transketolase [Armatimonadota bacterium]